MEIKKKKSNKGLVAIIIILLIALLGAIGYICYDKGVFDSLLNKEKPVEEPKQDEKLSEEEVMKLHKSLLSNNKKTGFYFDRKTSIDQIPSNLILEYAFSNYFDENNITFDSNTRITVCGESSFDYHFCALGDESEKQINNEATKKQTIKKEVIDNYIKKLFNTDRDFVYNKSIIVVTDKNILNVYYNYDKKEYYIVIPHSDMGNGTVSNKFIRFEQNNDEVYIYDKAVVCVSDLGYLGISKFIYLDYWSASETNNTIIHMEESGKVYDSNKKVVTDGRKYFNSQSAECKFDLIYQDFDSELNTYKHTFKKGSDGKYYWYSSEVVSEQNNSQNTSENTTKSHKSEFLDILAGKRKYINENNKEVTINSFGKVNGWEINLNGSAKISKHALVDMDSDGSEELIALIEDYDGFYLILHYENGKIYGYEDGQRGITQLKTNGYYYGSCGADCGSVLRSTFNKNVRTQKTLADNNNGIYKINGKKATKKEFNKYLDKFNSYKDVTWIKY